MINKSGRVLSLTLVLVQCWIELELRGVEAEEKKKVKERKGVWIVSAKNSKKLKGIR